MDNVLQTNGVPLTVFGGAVPELAPEDLPEGASPFNQDCDYNPGSVFTRGGRTGVYTFLNNTILRNPFLGQSLPGAHAPNEAAWTNPNNITLNNPATPAICVLNGAATATIEYGLDTHTQSGTTGLSWSASAPANAIHPSAFFSTNPSGAITIDTPGWTNGLFGFGGQDYWETMSPGGTATMTFHLSGAQPISNGLLVTVQGDGQAPIKGTSYGGSSGVTSTVTIGPAGQFSAVGIVYWMNVTGTGFTFGGVATPWDPTQSTVSDNVGNFWQFIGVSEAVTSNTGMTFTSIWTCLTPVPNAKPTITITLRTSAGSILNVGNMSVNLSEMQHWIATGIYAGADQLLQQSNNGVNGFTIGPLTPNETNSFCIVVAAQSNNNAQPMTIPSGWGNYPGVTSLTWGNFFARSIAAPISFTTSWGGAPSNYAAVMINLPQASGIGAYPWHTCDNFSGSWPPAPLTLTFGANVLTAGNMIVVFSMVANISTAPANVTYSDTQNNHYNVFTSGGQSNGTAFCAIGVATNIAGGANNVITLNASGIGTSHNTEAYEFYMGPVPPNTSNFSQVLTGSGYVNLPLAETIMGLQVIVAGNQTSAASSSVVNVSLNIPGSQTFQVPLNNVNNSFTIATPLSNWGVQLTPALINNLQIQVVASSPVQDTISIYALQLKVNVSPNPPSNFNYIKTYEQTDGEIDTLLLDAAGFLWDEDVDSNPTVLNTIPNASILPNTFAKSVTFNDIEYIAFSNLQNGTDVPRQWNGTNLDRISMVGPGDKCQASVTGGSGGSNTTPIATITQAPKVQIRRISWGASINAQSDSTPGNVLVVSLPGGSTHGGNPPLNMNNGDTVVLSSITNPFPLKGGGSLPYNLNGTYTIQSNGAPIIGGGETDTAFTLQAPAVQYGYSNDFGVPPTSGWFYQDCVATVTLQAPLPNVNVNSQITISGTSTPYDNTWTVIAAPNASAMTITQAVLVGGIATYSFNLAVGSQPPAQNQTVSVANCLNGTSSNDPNIFNFPAKQIQSVSISGTSGSFTVQLPGPDVTPPQNQQGNQPPATANVAGTIFKFDAGQIVNSGNQVTGGAIVTAGQVATGIRKVCYCFLTRSGYITQPSPINTFNVTSGAGSITVTGLSPGPPNVVARIVCFTGANGGNFFYIPTTQYVTVSGQTPIKNDSTILNNNSQTTATFSFSDAVLLSATAIDIPGNNLFNTIELGSCRGLITYASRMFAWSEQLKVTNFRNLSFDGGYNSASGTLLPLGWALDPTNGSGGSLSLGSSVFGWSYFINNSTVSTQTTYGMLTQNAYQDEFGVAIIQANAFYSVRITALCQPQPQSGGNLVVDLFSPNVVGAILGSFSIPLASMTTTMQIYTGTLLTNVLTAPVPSDLQLRIYATSIPAGAQILIDRVEPFQTLVPVLTTALKGSYANNQEAFDLTTGVCGPSQNSQPINGALELFDLLYALKEKSWFSTFDNGVTEPNRWNWKEVSNKVGTIGIHSYDWGEGWAVTANRQGAYFFEGGEPIKISQEIQPVWDAINWQYGYTLWMRNDPEQRRITIGVPIATPNQWMPEFPVNANPTSPNVVLMMNYRELNTGSALAQTGPIRSTFTGRLMSPEPARKWSFWNIACPYSDFISRANNQWPQLYCTGYSDSKVFTLQAASLNDDGLAINSFWVSYGFVKPEAADAKGLGLFRMEFPYFTVLATGSGVLNTYVYPESPFNLPYALDATSLPTQSQGDLEIGVNVKGQRFFVRVGTNAVGAAFRCSKMVVPLIPDTWAPIRGYNVITA